MEPEFGGREEERQAVGPLTDAYLHREVHPDDQPVTKAQHGIGKHDALLFPKSDTATDPHIEDIWMYT